MPDHEEGKEDSVAKQVKALDGAAKLNAAAARPSPASPPR